MDLTASWSSPSNSSLHLDLYYCNDPRVSISILAFGFTRNVFILPFTFLVLYQGHQRWWQQGCNKAMSQSDFIIYHFAFMQLLGVPGNIIFICGFHTPYLFSVGICILTFLVIGELLFHVVICVERYLAVLHPITYLELKNPKGARIRGFCVGGVWFFSTGWVFLIILYAPSLPVIPFFCLCSLCFIIVSFCSLSVLRALIRPGPGEVAGEKERVDQSKQKAFHTVMVITGALWLLFIGHVVSVALDSSGVLGQNERCWAAASSTWFSLPSSLVVPLLFLHRAGKLTCCCVCECGRTKEGPGGV